MLERKSIYNTRYSGFIWKRKEFYMKKRLLSLIIVPVCLTVLFCMKECTYTSIRTKCCFAANRTGRIFPLFRWKWFCTFWTTWNKIRCKLMFTNAALVLLVTEFIFAIFIKFFGVASWATMWYNFIHEILISFLWFSGRYSGLW